MTRAQRLAYTHVGRNNDARLPRGMRHMAFRRGNMTRCTFSILTFAHSRWNSALRTFFKPL